MPQPEKLPSPQSPADSIASAACAVSLVFDAPEGAVRAVGGIASRVLRALVDEVEPDAQMRHALFLALGPATSAAAYVEQVIGRLAEAVLRLWPVWYGGISFAMCGNNTLGRQAAGVITREAAPLVPGLSPPWTEAAARLALEGRLPRPRGVLPEIELMQLSLAISRGGLVLVIDLAAVLDAPHHDALVQALEWTARQCRIGIVALFPAALPAFEPPFDRILYGARQVVAAAEPEVLAAELKTPADRTDELWLGPWRGAPHPMSMIEQRIKKLLDTDRELAPLFKFNCSILTTRGSRFRGDLVWLDGGLVVELDGYPDHSTPQAFRKDRHRDYELTLSGFTVLRLTNDEIVQDFERAIEKIRDLVRWRRSLLK